MLREIVILIAFVIVVIAGSVVFDETGNSADAVETAKFFFIAAAAVCFLAAFRQSGDGR